MPAYGHTFQFEPSQLAGALHRCPPPQRSAPVLVQILVLRASRARPERGRGRDDTESGDFINVIVIVLATRYIELPSSALRW